MGTLPITQAIIRGLFLAAATGDPRAPTALYREAPGHHQPRPAAGGHRTTPAPTGAEPMPRRG